MSDTTLERVHEDSPDRCQGGSSTLIQCPFKKEPGSDYCGRHRGLGGDKSKRQEIRNYQLSRWGARVNEFSDSNTIKSLREEVGILRLTLETILNALKNEEELIIYSGKVSEIVQKIDKVVTSCHKLELANSQLLDKTKILMITEKFVQIISEHVKDETIIDLITNQIAEVVL